MKNTETNDSFHDASVGRRLRMIGVALIAASMIWWGAVARFIQAPNMAALVLLNWHALTFPLGLYLLYRGKQYLAKSNPAQHLDDPRPPIVLLRPFSVDTSTKSRVILGLFNPMLAATQFVTVEEQLTKVLRPIGPLVAIGMPTEALPPPGASRFHESDNAWQQRITDIFKKARLVLLVPGESEGVLWEAKTAFLTLEPKQVVIFAHLNMKPDAYEALSRICEEVTGRALPKFLDFKKRRGICITFDKNWSPQILSTRRAPFFRGLITKGVKNYLHYSLKPLFQENGVEWRPHPISVSQVLFSGMAFLILAGVITLIVAAIIDSQTGKYDDYASHYHAGQSQQEFEANSQANQEHFDAELRNFLTKLANQTNQTLPKMEDEYTRLDEVTVGPGARLVFHRTFPKYASMNFGENWIHTRLNPELMRVLCSNDLTNELLQNGVILVYEYYRDDGVEITQFEIGRNDCGLPEVRP